MTKRYENNVYYWIKLRKEIFRDWCIGQYRYDEQDFFYVCGNTQPFYLHKDIERVGEKVEKIYKPGFYKIRYDGMVTIGQYFGQSKWQILDDVGHLMTDSSVEVIEEIEVRNEET